MLNMFFVHCTLRYIHRGEGCRLFLFYLSVCINLPSVVRQMIGFSRTNTFAWNFAYSSRIQYLFQQPAIPLAGTGYRYFLHWPVIYLFKAAGYSSRSIRTYLLQQPDIPPAVTGKTVYRSRIYLLQQLDTYLLQHIQIKLLKYSQIYLLPLQCIY